MFKSESRADLGLKHLGKYESHANLDLDDFQINDLGIEIYQIMSPFENIGRSYLRYFSTSPKAGREKGIGPKVNIKMSRSRF